MSQINDLKHQFQSPISDFTGLLGNCQHYWRCRELELNVLDCTDVFGYKGLKKECKEEVADFHECIYGFKQEARVQAMKEERMRQYLNGERSKKNLYAETPKLDSYYKTYGTSID